MKPVIKNGKPMILVDARIGGAGERKFFPTKAEAEGWAQVCRLRRKNEGTLATVDERLARYGWTVSKAVTFALAHLERQAAGIPLPEVIDSLVAQKAATGRSMIYQKNLRARLGRVAQAFSGKSIGAITTADLDDFLATLGESVAPGTVNTFRRDIRTCWSFAERRGWAQASVAKFTEAAQANPCVPGILTPQQAANLMRETQDPETVAFHAIALFAGVRVAEIKKLDWRDVDFESGFIHVAAATSKTRSRRLVPILPNLDAWLRPLAKKGPIITRDIRVHHEAAREAAGIRPWPDNAMRHSFVSSRLAASGDAARTALESGHDQAVLFKNYREVCRPKDAALYFAILPAKGANVIPMRTAAA